MNVTGIVFTNDASLGELTTKRTMASLPFGGRYRQVDWALSIWPAPVSVISASSPATTTSP